MLHALQLIQPSFHIYTRVLFQLCCVMFQLKRTLFQLKRVPFQLKRLQPKRVMFQLKSTLFQLKRVPFQLKRVGLLLQLKRVILRLKRASFQLKHILFIFSCTCLDNCNYTTIYTTSSDKLYNPSKHRLWEGSQWAYINSLLHLICYIIRTQRRSRYTYLSIK